MTLKPLTGHPRYDAIIFDWGDVIGRKRVEELVPEVCALFGVDRETLIRAYIRAAEPYERGAIDSQEFARLFLDGVGFEGRMEVRDVMAFPVKAWSAPEPSMLRLVEMLRGPYKTALLSNNIPEVVEAIRKEVRLEDLFDIIILSYEVGMRKPEAGIYEVCLERLALDASRAVFIDNHPSMCEGAEAVGIKSLHFTSYGKLTEDLTRLGVVAPMDS